MLPIIVKVLRDSGTLEGGHGGNIRHGLKEGHIHYTRTRAKLGGGTGGSLRQGVKGGQLHHKGLRMELD